MKTEAAGCGVVERGRQRGLQMNAGLGLISDQVMRQAEQRVYGQYADWIGYFLRDGLASLGDCEHSIELSRPSIKTVQLADETKLLD